MVNAANVVVGIGPPYGRGNNIVAASRSVQRVLARAYKLWQVTYGAESRSEARRDETGQNVTRRDEA